MVGGVGSLLLQVATVEGYIFIAAEVAHCNYNEK